MLIKDPKKRLGGGLDDAKEIMVHPFFGNIIWQELLERKVSFSILTFPLILTQQLSSHSKVQPPFKPQVTSDTDTRYFDQEFTGESVELTPPDPCGPLNAISEEAEQPYFQQFSYHGSAGHLANSLANSLARSPMEQ